jgi:hypothetical protein
MKALLRKPASPRLQQLVVSILSIGLVAATLYILINSPA